MLCLLQTAALFEGFMRKKSNEVIKVKFEWRSVSSERGGKACTWSYTRVVECWCGRALLLWLGTGVEEGVGMGGYVLKGWRGCMLLMVLGIIVMVLAVMSGTSSGARLRASV